MKTLIFACVLVLFTHQVLCNVNANVNRQACLRDVSVRQSLVDNAYNGQIGDARELKCYFKCYYENAGYMNSKGEIVEHQLKSNLPAGVSRTAGERAVESCKGHKGKDACETAFLVQKCLLNNNVKY